MGARQSTGSTKSPDQLWLRAYTQDGSWFQTEEEPTGPNNSSQASSSAGGDSDRDSDLLDSDGESVGPLHRAPHRCDVESTRAELLQLHKQYGSTSHHNAYLAVAPGAPLSLQQEVEETPSKKQRIRKPCCCGRLSRCACWSLISCILGAVAVLLLLTFLVLLPHVVQQTVNMSKIDFQSVLLSDPTDDSIHFHSVVKLYDTGAFDATMHSATFTITFQGDVLGTLQLPDIQLHANQPLTMSLDSLVHLHSVHVFDAFATSLIQDKQIQWTMSGHVDLTAHFLGLSLPFHGVSYSKEVTLLGFDGLPGVVLDIFQVFSPSDEAPPIMEVQLAVPNVAVFSIENLGDLTFDLLFAGSKLASLQVANLAFGEGINRFTMKGPLIPANMIAANELFSAYLQGQSTNLLAKGDSQHASSIPLYNGFLSVFELATELKGLDQPLLSGAIMTLDWEQWIDGLKAGKLVIPTRLAVTNPFDALVRIVEVSLWVTFEGTRVAKLFQPLEDPILVGGNSTIITQDLPIQLIFENDTIQLIKALGTELFAGKVFLGTNGKLKYKIGNMEANPNYSQPPIPVCRTMVKCGLQLNPVPLTSTNGQRPGSIP